MTRHKLVAKVAACYAAADAEIVVMHISKLLWPDFADNNMHFDSAHVRRLMAQADKVFGGHR